MATTIGRRKHSVTQLIRAARGQRPPLVGAQSSAAAPPPRTNKPLPCFPLQRHHLGRLVGGDDASAGAGAVAAPSDFHSYLCKRIPRARERVILASLYVGVGSKTALTPIQNNVTADSISKEDELLQSLHNVACSGRLKKMQVLLDANRALRTVSITRKGEQSHGPSGSGSGSSSSSRMIQTNSAEAVFSTLHPHTDKKSPGDESSSGLFLFPVNDKRLCTILPSPLDEVAGVFHIKAYIVDDELILSGANLSEEYFSSRLDRYMLFVNGGGGLVDFYADLCDILCEYAIRYDGRSRSGEKDLLSFFSFQNEKAKKEELEASLMQLFDGNNQADDNEMNPTAPIVAYAIPTFQMPASFLGRPLQFHSDAMVTRDLLLSALNMDQPTSIRLSSAYLNLTPKLLSVLTMYGRKNDGAPYVLTAGTISHGFAPKGSRRKKVGIVDSVKAAIPKAFMTLVMDTAQLIMACGGKVLLYERHGWTFHAKGIWITANNCDDSNCPERICKPSSLLATIIGSGNYGARSEDLDVESNCILVFNGENEGNDNAVSIREYAAAEWNNMCESSNVLKDVKVTDDRNRVMMVLEFFKRLL